MVEHRLAKARVAGSTPVFRSKFMVGVVKWLRHRIVVPACVGSIPITHPIYFLGYSQVGKATDFDSVIRRFESYYPSHLFGPLAQLVEHLTFNQGVPRSSRGWITIFFYLELDKNI